MIDAERVKELNNIVDVISTYFPLKKKGANYLARCPFHEEKSASFTVSDKKQIFYCFGCKKGGDVISFVKEYERLSYVEALEKLAKRVGVPITQSPQQSKEQSRKELIHKIYEITQGHYADNLRNFGDSAMQYLKNRSISAEIINTFQLGLALDSYNGLRNYLIKNSINTKILSETGLFVDGSTGQFDFFRNRVMFPIHSNYGRIVAFGGRTLEENPQGGKYINTSTTPIYQKGNELYGLYLTKHEVSRQNEVIVCEGYMDMIRLYACGFKNSVASLGTALTENQISLISRYTKNILLMYDGDKAGRMASLKAGKLAIAEGFSVKVVILPDGEDPDTYLINNPREKMEALMKDALSFLDFVKTEPKIDMDNRARIDFFVELLNEIEDKITVDILLKQIAESFGITELSLASKINFKKTNNSQKNLQINMESLKNKDEVFLLSFLIEHPQYREKVCSAINRDYFFSVDLKNLFTALIEKGLIDDLESANQVADKLEDEKLKQIFISIMFEEVPSDMDINILLENMKLRKLEIDLNLVNDKINKGENSPEIFAEKSRIKKEISQISKKVVTKSLFQGV